MASAPREALGEREPPAGIGEPARAIVGLARPDERNLRAHERTVDTEERDQRVVTRIAPRLAVAREHGAGGER